MRRAALPVLIIACVIVAAVLAWLVLQRVFRPPSPAPGGPAVAEVLVPGPFSSFDTSPISQFAAAFASAPAAISASK